jgi:hypothetical protein
VEALEHDASEPGPVVEAHVPPLDHGDEPDQLSLLEERGARLNPAEPDRGGEFPDIVVGEWRQVATPPRSGRARPRVGASRSSSPCHPKDCHEPNIPGPDSQEKPFPGEQCLPPGERSGLSVASVGE